MAEVKPSKYAGGEGKWPADVGRVFAEPVPAPYMNVKHWEVTADRAGPLGKLERLEPDLQPDPALVRRLPWRALYPDNRNGPRRATRWEAVRDMVDRKRGHNGPQEAGR